MASLNDLGFTNNRRPLAVAPTNRKIFNPFDIDNQIVDPGQLFPDKILDFSKIALESLSVNEYIQSSNYSTGVSGWRIGGDGVAEFQSVTAADYNRIYKQSGIPTSDNEGDLWVDTDDDKVYRAGAAGADEIKSGEWEEVKPQATDTDNVNSIAASTVQPRAELSYKNFSFVGNPNDGLTENANGGTISRYLYDTKVSKSAAGNANPSLTSAQIGAAITFSSSWEIHLVVSIDTSTAQVYFFFGVDDAGDATISSGLDDSPTKRHVGFLVYGATPALYASNADGTTQTKSAEITGYTLTNSNHYHIIKSGSTMTFYVNDNLEATHTTQTPTGASPRVTYGFNNQNVSQPAMTVGNNIIALTAI